MAIIDNGLPTQSPDSTMDRLHQHQPNFPSVFWPITLIALVVCGLVGWMLWGQRPSDLRDHAIMEPSPEDYAIARHHFQTKLQHHGQAPEGFGDCVSPDDVDEVEYQSGDLKLKAWITAEPETIRVQKPAVMYLHDGFSFSEDDWHQVIPFEEAGFVVMIPMLRGQNGLPGDYSLFYNEVDDVLAATDFLAKQPHVDPNRLFLVGNRTGGTLAILTVMTTPRYLAAVSFSGAGDIARWTKKHPEIVPFNPRDPLEMRMRSPLAFPHSFKSPMQLYYGQEEDFYRESMLELTHLAQNAGRDIHAREVPGNHSTMIDAAIPAAISYFHKFLAEHK